MKKQFLLTTLLVLLISSVFSQIDTGKTSPDTLYVITTTDGGEFIGTIISQDEREVLINTNDRGKISIPKYQIVEMRKINEGELTESGNYIPAEVFSTRYFLTTNGLPIQKGESYILWSLWGPDFQFGVGKNFSIGIITTWLAWPVIGTAKYSIPLGEKSSLGLGALLGTTTWAYTQYHFGFALPFAALTFGDRTKNLTFSGGYGSAWSSTNSASGTALLSVAGMIKVGKKTTCVFDSFIVPASNTNETTVALIMPGIRLQTKSKSAFQFGFTGIVADGEALPVPIPTVQWFTKL